MEEKSSSDEGNFNNPSVDSSDENEKKLDQSPKNKIIQNKNNILDNNDDFKIESREENKIDKNNDNENIYANENLKDSMELNGINNENNKNEELKDKIKNNDKIENNNSSQYRNFSKGNELIQNKKKDIIQIEIDKEKTSQKKFTVYQINLMNDNSIKFNSNINETNEKKILCYRRYKDFEKFYNTLKIRYPHCVFPRLSQKNYKNKLIFDPIFEENRRKELQYFINKLYFHEQIGKSEEFKQFLYYSIFDEEYYNTLPKKYFYPVCEKYKNDKGYLSIGMEKLSGFFYKPKDYKKSDLEKSILDREEEFKNKDTRYNDLLKEIKALFDTADEEAKEFKIMSNNILYLKDNSSTMYKNKENDNIKNKFNELVNLNKNFAGIIENNSIVYLSEILDQLNNCILDVEGINKAIERYIKFNDDFKKIQEINVKNNKYILEEKEKAKNDKSEFEKSLYDDIQKYDKENNKIYEEIIQKIVFYIKVVNENNDEAFQNSNFIN